MEINNDTGNHFEVINIWLSFFLYLVRTSGSKPLMGNNKIHWPQLLPPQPRVPPFCPAAHTLAHRSWHLLPAALTHHTEAGKEGFNNNIGQAVVALDSARPASCSDRAAHGQAISHLFLPLLPFLLPSLHLLKTEVMKSSYLKEF